MDIFSCDTMVALGNSTKSGKVIFAKNSDRPILEAQPLCVYPAKFHNTDDMLKCTYISIPQVSHTYRIIGSRPFWIWGFEHGMNEHNVIIGNEAVWSREEMEETVGLLGMDLVRLGLERGKTAYEALHIITELLEKYGQSANAAQHYEHRYNSSFLIADPNEAWVLDTCNRRWVARKVKDVQGISNCYSTQEEWDEDSGDIKEYAISKGWISKEVTFNFAKAYSSMSPKHRAAHPRFMRLNKLLEANKGSIDIQTMRTIQRDHFEGELIEPRWSPADALHVTICMHAINEVSSKTAASCQVELEDNKESIWWNCFSNPCESIYMPISMSKELPEILSYAKEKFEDKSLWWAFERLVFEMEKDYPYYIEKWKKVQDKWEKELCEEVEISGSITSERMNEIAQTFMEIVNKMYEEISLDGHVSNNPQRINMCEKLKELSGM